VLEHLESIDDVALAWSKLNRIADRIFLLYPGKWQVVSQLMPSHHLWVKREGDDLFVEERFEPFLKGYVTATGEIRIVS
jgi:hypothetical protein